MPIRDGDEVVGISVIVAGVILVVASGLRILELPTSAASYVTLGGGLIGIGRGVFLYRRGRPLVLKANVPPNS